MDDYDDGQGGGIAAPQLAVLPEIKLFSRWSCDDVEVPDMSLQVSIIFTFYDKYYGDTLNQKNELLVN